MSTPPATPRAPVRAADGVASTASPGPVAPWWHGAVLYQLYVRSWRDSDGDGHGDLGGVVEGLDYLAWLGVDGLWLSPTMPSPDDDWGYDVADYLGVHPDLGTLDDLDRLVAEAGRRGMRVLLDLVPNHTSSAHPWFVDARSARDAEHRDFYVWAEPGKDGGPPNNWRDHTDHSAWTLDPATGQYYLHNFLESQPDLNWWNPAVHAAFEEVLAYWLDRGVAGFRIDVAHGLYKDAMLRDDPPAEPGDPRSHFGLLPTYSAHRPEVHGVYRRWRAVAESYSPPAVLLGETWVHDVGELARFYGDDDELQLAFNFPFVFAALEAGSLPDVVRRTLDSLPAGACPVWMASNHDISRFATRWCAGDASRTRLAVTVLATLPGAVVLYYGDEIGMADVDVPRHLQRDPMTRDGHPEVFRRDRARTPMQWEPTASGGFAPQAVTPWLPLGDSSACNVASQLDDPGSMLHLTHSLLALRRAALGGTVSGYEQLASGADQWVYRVGPLVVAANLSDDICGVDGLFESVLVSSGGGVPDGGPRPSLTCEGSGDAHGSRARSGHLELGPWQAVVTGPAALSGVG